MKKKPSTDPRPTLHQPSARPTSAARGGVPPTEYRPLSTSRAYEAPVQSLALRPRWGLIRQQRSDAQTQTYPLEQASFGAPVRPQVQHRVPNPAYQQHFIHYGLPRAFRRLTFSGAFPQRRPNAQHEALRPIDEQEPHACPIPHTRPLPARPASPAQGPSPFVTARDMAELITGLGTELRREFRTELTRLRTSQEEFHRSVLDILQHQQGLVESPEVRAARAEEEAVQPRSLRSKQME